MVIPSDSLFGGRQAGGASRVSFSSLFLHMFVILTVGSVYRALYMERRDTEAGIRTVDTAAMSVGDHSHTTSSQYASLLDITTTTRSVFLDFPDLLHI